MLVGVARITTLMLEHIAIIIRTNAFVTMIQISGSHCEKSNDTNIQYVVRIVRCMLLFASMLVGQECTKTPSRQRIIRFILDYGSQGYAELNFIFIMIVSVRVYS